MESSGRILRSFAPQATTRDSDNFDVSYNPIDSADVATDHKGWFGSDLPDINPAISQMAEQQAPELYASIRASTDEFFSTATKPSRPSKRAYRQILDSDDEDDDENTPLAPGPKVCEKVDHYAEPTHNAKLDEHDSDDEFSDGYEDEDANAEIFDVESEVESDNEELPDYTYDARLLIIFIRISNPITTDVRAEPEFANQLGSVINCLRRLPNWGKASMESRPVLVITERCSSFKMPLEQRSAWQRVMESEAFDLVSIGPDRVTRMVDKFDHVCEQLRQRDSVWYTTAAPEFRGSKSTSPWFEATDPVNADYMKHVIQQEQFITDSSTFIGARAGDVRDVRLGKKPTRLVQGTRDLLTAAFKAHAYNTVVLVCRTSPSRGSSRRPTEKDAPIKRCEYQIEFLRTLLDTDLPIREVQLPNVSVYDDGQAMADALLSLGFNQGDRIACLALGVDRVVRTESGLTNLRTIFATRKAEWDLDCFGFFPYEDHDLGSAAAALDLPINDIDTKTEELWQTTVLREKAFQQPGHPLMQPFIWFSTRAVDREFAQFDAQFKLSESLRWSSTNRSHLLRFNRHRPRTGSFEMKLAMLRSFKTIESVAVVSIVDGMETLNKRRRQIERKFWASLTPDEYEAARQRNRQYQKERRDAETPEQHEARLAKQRVANLSEETLERVRASGRIENMSAEKRERKNFGHRKENMTPVRLEKKNAGMRVANITAEQREKRNAKRRVANLPEEKIIQMREKGRVSGARYRSNRTEEKRKKKIKHDGKVRTKRIADMSEVNRKDYRAKEAARVAAYRAKKKAEKKGRKA
ncbi:hypothetical protein PspLS_11597 [Pyricularia sp. CBS 133598]|nr:hypothetical protein PspLS_11597 [Pyricularia sp. CBS 133598]